MGLASRYAMPADTAFEPANNAEEMTAGQDANAGEEPDGLDARDPPGWTTKPGWVDISSSVSDMHRCSFHNWARASSATASASVSQASDSSRYIASSRSRV